MIRAVTKARQGRYIIKKEEGTAVGGSQGMPQKDKAGDTQGDA